MPVDAATRAALVEHARLSIKRGSQSFSAAARLFDKETRERAWLLYAWCRRADDIADNQDMGGVLGDQSDLAGRLALIRRLTALAFAGEPTGDPAFDAPFDLSVLQRDVSEKLIQNGNPYQFNILDIERSLSLDLGVSGAPETFIIDASGTVRAHHIGDINPQVWRAKLAPLYQQWSQP